MKKALQITIAGTLFTIEDDAYAKLDDYLQSIKKYFSTYPDNAEILQDIEARIAERLLESIKETHDIVTIDVVKNVVSAMGTVADFADATGEKSQTETSSSDGMPMKRLYRNPEDVVIAGVASGIGVFFGIDPLIIRVLFVILAFVTSGAVILVYIILALLIPKAQTAAEKIQMKGGPMTLNSFRENVQEHVDTVKTNGTEYLGHRSKLRTVLNKIFSIFGIIIRTALKILIVVIGTALILGAAFGLIAGTFAFINLTFNVHSPYVEFPVAEVLGGPLYYFMITLGYVLLVIPLVFIATIGMSFIRRKKTLGMQSTLSLGAVWIVALLIAGTLSVRYIPETHEKILALPQYQVMSKTEDLKGFNKLELHGIDSVHLTQDDTYSVSERGRQIDVERVQFTVQDNTLILTQRSREKMCFFCLGRERVDISITMPDIQAIETSGAISLSADELTTESLSLTSTGVSSIELDLETKALVVDQSGATRINIEGSSPVLKVEASGVARFNGQNFAVQSATVDTSGNTEIKVNAANSLNVSASGVSEILYRGTPKITEDLSGHARIRQFSEM
ncbi:DUF2807 domain-containing protein [Candidatus Parcubacteria bacterium]|nr:DUF2807 domain-containing protein [Candidatus Parcubacteria bacterium]